MLDVSQNHVVVGALMLWGAYSVVHLTGETRKLAHIPSIGFSNPILSYISAIHLLLDPVGFLEKEWEKIPLGTPFVKVPNLARWVVYPVLPEGYQEVVRAPDSKLSVTMATDDTLQAKYTMYLEEIDDNLQVIPIRGKLTKLLGDLVPEVYDEMVATFKDEFPLNGDEWRPFVALPTVIDLVARISNRVLVGLPLCRNPEYVENCVGYAVDVFVFAYLLPLFPGFIRGIVNWLVSPIPRRIRKATQFYQPLLDAHRKGMAELGEQYEPPTTLITWLADIADQYHPDRADRDVVLRMMSTNFGSIHTTSLTLTHALFSLLSRPQYVETVRDEIARCVGEEGWTRAAMDKMQFLDSFMKESQRFDVIAHTLGLRVTVEDCTLSGVLIPKGILVGANAIKAHFDSSVFGDSAYEFDPYRFIKLEEETGKRVQLPTSTLNTLTFGYGRHACPGRFFAAQEMKLLMAYFLHYYDLRLETKDGERPKNLWLGMGNTPNVRARVLMRRRKGAL